MDILDLPVLSAETSRTLPVALLNASPFHLRRHLDPDALDSLAATIRTHGVLQPILVRPVEGGRYEVIAGERRWRAACLAGLKVVPAISRPLSDRDALAVALIENIQHEALHPLEEAQALARLIREFRMTHQQAADAVGRSRSTVSNLLRLLELSPGVQAMLAAGRLDMGHARALLSLPASDQERVAGLIAGRGLSVREAEQLARTAPAERSAKPSQENHFVLLAHEIGQLLGVRARIRAVGPRRRIVLDCENDDRFVALMARLASLATDDAQPRLSDLMSRAVDPNQVTEDSGPTAAVSVAPLSSPPHVRTTTAPAARDARQFATALSAAAPAAASCCQAQPDSDVRLFVSGATDVHIDAPLPVVPVADSRRAWAEASARRDLADLAGQPLLVSCLLTPQGEQLLDPPSLFHIAPEQVLSLNWQGDRLAPRWQVVPAAPCPQAEAVGVPLWIAGHSYTLAGEFQASRHFSTAIAAPSALANAPLADISEPAQSEARPADNVATAFSAEEQQALQQYQQMLGQLVETSEIRGRHHSLGEERVRLIPPVQLRVIETPPAELLRRRDGMLQPTWRVVPVLPDPALDELTDLRMPAPLPGSTYC